MLAIEKEMVSAFTQALNKTLRSKKVSVTYIPSEVKAYRSWVSLFKGNLMAQGFSFDKEN